MSARTLFKPPRDTQEMLMACCWCMVSSPASLPFLFPWGWHYRNGPVALGCTIQSWSACSQGFPGVQKGFTENCAMLVRVKSVNVAKKHRHSLVYVCAIDPDSVAVHELSGVALVHPGFLWLGISGGGNCGSHGAPRALDQMPTSIKVLNWGSKAISKNRCLRKFKFRIKAFFFLGC